MSTEYYDPSVGSWLYGPVIAPMFSHCAVPIQQKTKILLIGGKHGISNDFKPTTFIFDPQTGKMIKV